MKKYFMYGVLGFVFSAVFQTTCIYGQNIEIQQKEYIEKGSPLNKINLKDTGRDKTSRESQNPVKKQKRVVYINLNKTGEKNINKVKNSTEVSLHKEAVKENNGPNIEIGILSGCKQVQITGLQNFYISGAGKEKNAYQQDNKVILEQSGNKIIANGKKFDGPVYFSTDNDKSSFDVKGNQYRGKMKVISSKWSSGLTVVNVIPIELYLRGVVPSEVIPSWEIDVVKAQAVAARTYAVFHKNQYRSAGYDLTDDTRSQVYKGVSAETEVTNKAIKSTSGEIITYGGKAIDALFHANGGGYTEDSENVWGSYVPYLRGVKEEESRVLSKAWVKVVPIREFSGSVAKSGYPVGKIKELILSRLKIGNKTSRDRGISGRVKFLEVNGQYGKKQIPGETLQSIFGLQSTLFDISIKGKDIIFTGYGWGHGLGLSQWGAKAMAEKYGDGKDYYKKILTHYFSGTKIEKIY